MVVVEVFPVGLVFLQGKDNIFNMLAGARAVHPEVGTGAVIVAVLIVPDRYFIGLIRFGIIHLEVAKYRMTAYVFNFKILFGGELFSQGRLPFLHGKIFRFAVIGYFLLFLGVGFFFCHGAMLWGKGKKYLIEQVV